MAWKPFFDQTKNRVVSYYREASNQPLWQGLAVATVSLFFWWAVYQILFAAPGSFNTSQIVRIERGSGVAAAADLLYQKNMVKSPFLFRLVIGSRPAIAGYYYFDEPFNVFEISRRVAAGTFGLKPYKITIPEGSNNKEIADLLDKKLPYFNSRKFLELAAGLEGRLFPDTYYFNVGTDEKDIIAMMTDNFEKKITEHFGAELSKLKKDLNEYLTMASILEKETRTAESRRMVAGILYNRLSQGMKLQVDAVFYYLLGKYSLHLTKADLQYDSPYNTYLYKGLPPGPIGNPGLDAINAAMHPTKSSYLYYLSDAAGNLHYAKSLAGHKENRARYLP